jgi:hypothetical protein
LYVLVFILAQAKNQNFKTYKNKNIFFEFSFLKVFFSFLFSKNGIVGFHKKIFSFFRKKRRIMASFFF